MSIRRELSRWFLGVCVFALWSCAPVVAWSAESVVFVVFGTITDADGVPQSGWSVTVSNVTLDWTASVESGDGFDPGVYQVLRLDPISGAIAATTGDEITVTYVAPDGRRFVTEYVLSDEDVQSARLESNLELGGEPQAPEDVSGDGVINIVDLVIVAQNFGRTGATLIGDVDKNGVVNIIDLVLIARRFGTSALGAPAAFATHGRALIAAEATGALDSDVLHVQFRLADLISDGAGVAGFSAALRFDPSLLFVRAARATSSAAIGTDRFTMVSDGTSADPGVVVFLSVDLASSGQTGGLASDLGHVVFGVVGDRAKALRSLDVVRATLVDRAARVIDTVVLPLRRQARLSTNARTIAGQNYPNPFNPETWIPFQLDEAADVSVRIFDSAGLPVRSLELGVRSAGAHVGRSGAAYWDGRNAAGERVSSGVYFYEFRAADYRRVGKMVVAK